MTGRLELTQGRHDSVAVRGGCRAARRLEVGQDAEVTQRPIGTASPDARTRRSPRSRGRTDGELRPPGC